MLTTESNKQLKQKALEKYFSRLNPEQRRAVFQIDGPVLILAGAGSGKTTVLVNRIANMIYFGNSYHAETSEYTESERAFLKSYIEGENDDKETLREIVSVNPVNPWNILAITFTNKAATELKERISLMLGESSDGILAATFHSACVRILRRESEHTDYGSNFTIYDTDDQKRVIKSVLKDLNISDKMFPPKSMLGIISRCKESLITPDAFEQENAQDYQKKIQARIYKEYQRRLLRANAMDFDDIIALTVKLFEENPDVLNHYQNLYKYIVVDEYQDTNMVQYKLISLLSAKYKNLCVVGDDDQSIYKFRGATIENILSFENTFANTAVIRLEQNYRSTQNILNCANTLIKNNRGRKGKTLFTSIGNGDKVTLYTANNEKSEAKFVADTVLEGIKNGKKQSDFAVLYRMNAQSNAIEQAFIQSGVSYKIFGGTKFYDRKEIKDVLSYLSVVNNNGDLLRLRRIINEPKRSIGEATVTAIEQIASDLSLTPIEVMRDSESLMPLSKKAKVLVPLAEMFLTLQEISEQEPLETLLDELLERSDYGDYLRSQGDEGLMRLENIEELKSTMANYEESADEPSLSGFLEEIALFTDMDNMDENGDYVVMMTMHSAKGLEFDTVFAVGMEENIFPSQRSILDDADIEEERRLCYVAITRAKNKLYLTNARSRLLYGMTNHNEPSRFLFELDKSATEDEEEQIVTHSVANRYNPLGNRARNSMSLENQIKRNLKDKPQKNTQTFSAGDRISHNVFGEGTVLNAKAMANDTMLEIAFDTKGTKKVMANFARITKID
ncbi:MAG: UvrD-helicase domain-containing protein [Ruminococcus sp.]|nr:UvrD-helicase domain-containing protein [Ruminococcus sp.]